MKHFLLRLTLVCAAWLLTAAPRLGAQPAQNLLSPQDYLGFELDARMADWGDILSYADYLATHSDRVSVKRFGRTYERRPFIQVAITAPANQNRLEEIRQEHLKITDASVSGTLDLAKMPLVIDLRGTIHGNEISGAQGLLSLMYYYAASEDPAVTEMLEQTVLLVVPAQNPDGMSRFAMWVNGNASLHPFLDNQAREYHEPSPSSRANHYWMDTNRDWLTAQYPEGKNLVTMYEYWMPNVLLDLHEMGSSRGGLYYFSPGDPNRTFAYIPQRNQDLTLAISQSTRRALDSLGVSYFTGRGYDDYFIGKGACYGDIQGSVCILHELSSTRGHIRDYGDQGIHTFGETVQWQYSSAIAVVNGAVSNARELKEYQRDFFRDAARAAAADPVKGYVFDARGNRGLAFLFLENLRLHEIEVYPVAGQEGSYFVPFRQKHYYKIKGIFEDITEFQDSHFYDISTWSPTRAWNLNVRTVTEEPALGECIGKPVLQQGKGPAAPSSAGYTFQPDEFYTPRLVTELQRRGVTVQVDPATGTFFVPAGEKPADGEDLCALLTTLAGQYAVDVTARPETVKKRNRQPEPGWKPVRQPRTALITDLGGSSQQGSIWHMLDEHFAMNHSLVDFRTFTGRNFDINRYDALIFAGPVQMDGTNPEAWKRLKAWVEAGGTLILLGPAHTVSGTIGSDSISSQNGSGVSGLVLNAEFAAESPLFWGYRQRDIDIFKGNAQVWKVADDAQVVLRYSVDPYRSGYVTDENLAKFKGAPVAAVKHAGKGCILYIQEDLTYRGYWLGTHHILTNALLFGNLL